MSTAGTYHYWPKVVNPNAVLPQMTSDTYQPPFYFGGSQVPENLGMASGSGIQTSYSSHIDHMKSLPSTSRGIETTVKKHSKIYLPKHMSTIKKVV
jgi:hypothetical protein